MHTSHEKQPYTTARVRGWLKVKRTSTKNMKIKITIAVLVLGLKASAQIPEYTVVDLGILGDSGSAAYEINNRGEVVGWFYSKNGHIHAFLYSNGSMQDIGTLGGNDSRAYGINDNGQVVGQAETKDGQHHAFLFKWINARPRNTWRQRKRGIRNQ